MLLLLSPAKTLNEAPPLPPLPPTQPEFLAEAAQLVAELVKFTPKKLGALMDISDKLAVLNAERYRRFTLKHTPDNAHAALALFQGDVYVPIKAADYSAKQWRYAQEHVRILSGLYGLLRPLDVIQPYRLEMGTALANKRGKNLYDFWGTRLAKAMDALLEAAEEPVWVNLASQEYSKAVSQTKARRVTIDFKEKRNGGLQTIGLFAKKARGMITHFAITQGIDRAEGLKSFTEGGYSFQKKLSSDVSWVFAR